MTKKTQVLAANAARSSEMSFSDIKRFVEQLQPDGEAVFQVYSKAQAKVKKAEVFTGGIDRKTKERLTVYNQRGMEIAMLPNRSKTGGRRKENIVAINAVFIDSDDQKLTVDDLNKLAISPHMIVESSPDRFHAYWRVSGCEVSQFPMIQRALAEKFGTDTSVSDAGRVMRLPGTFNRKREPAFLTRIVQLDDGKPVHIDALVEGLGLDVDTVERPGAAGSSPALTDAMRAQVSSALAVLSSDDRAQWIRVGMAINSVAPDPVGYKLWTDWSQASSKFDAADQQTTWNGFKPGGGINIETLFWMASRVGPADQLIGDDVDAAHLFAATYKHLLRFEPRASTWFLFNGVVWNPSGKAADQLAQVLVADLKAGDGRNDTSLRKYRSHAGIRNIVKAAELLEELHIGPDAFNRDSGLFAVENGVIELDTGTFRAGSPGDYLSRAANVSFDADAKAPIWLSFIRQITCGDSELAMYLRRAIGYTMFGHANAQVFFVLEGSGGNGKGVILRVLKRLFGSYGCAPAPSLLTSAYAGNVNSPTPALAALDGQRLCIVTELPARKSYDTAFLKQFAGGDEITARMNYGDLVTFKPSGKLWVSTNEMPDIDAADKAMWRRLIPIPFNATFEGADRDDELEEKLWAERAGILNWAIKGAVDFTTGKGLGSCEAVDVHRSKRRRDADTVGQWLRARCAKDPEGKLQAAVAWTSYRDFMASIDGPAMTQKQFRDALEKRGLKRKVTKSHNVYLGLKLRS